jgi:hypothetical protein
MKKEEVPGTRRMDIFRLSDRLLLLGTDDVGVVCRLDGEFHHSVEDLKVLAEI